jgi:uncharacterized protein YuzE
MKIKYFCDTDTLYIELRDLAVAETRDLDENTVLDLDAEGNVSAITIGHASSRAGILSFPTSGSRPDHPAARLESEV